MWQSRLETRLYVRESDSNLFKVLDRRGIELSSLKVIAVISSFTAEIFIV